MGALGRGKRSATKRPGEVFGSGPWEMSSRSYRRSLHPAKSSDGLGRRSIKSSSIRIRRQSESSPSNRSSTANDENLTGKSSIREGHLSTRGEFDKSPLSFPRPPVDTLFGSPYDLNLSRWNFLKKHRSCDDLGQIGRLGGMYGV